MFSEDLRGRDLGCAMNVKILFDKDELHVLYAIPMKREISQHAFAMSIGKPFTSRMGRGYTLE